MEEDRSDTELGFGEMKEKCCRLYLLVTRRILRYVISHFLFLKTDRVF